MPYERRVRTTQSLEAATADPNYGLTQLYSGAGFYDSVARKILTNVNGVSLAPTPAGVGGSFAKASQQRLFENIAGASPAKYSFIAVVNATGTDAGYSNVFNVGKDSVGYAFQLRHTGTNWNFYHSDGSDILATGTYANGQQTIIGTWDGVNIHLYIGGVLVSTAATASIYPNVLPLDFLNIGSDYSVGAPVTSTYWDGQIQLFGMSLGTCWTDGQISSLSNNPWQLFEPELIWVPAPSGILFDAAGNSGDIAAASSYSGSVSWNGANRFLGVDVSMLGPGVTVTAMTYGGAAMTFIGSKSTVTSLGGVEQWRICSSDSGAPAAGSNTLSVTLSGSLEFTVEWASYTGVHQTSPTEGFNSAQATNAGSATDASVSITTVADNCWVHGAVVANDTSITANQTSRNNVSGTLGSGANEDNNAAKTPAGAVTMSYSGLGITTTWAIAGYAIRPLAASTLGGTFIGALMRHFPRLGRH